MLFNSDLALILTWDLIPKIALFKHIRFASRCLELDLLSPQHYLPPTSTLQDLLFS